MDVCEQEHISMIKCVFEDKDKRNLKKRIHVPGRALTFMNGGAHVKKPIHDTSYPCINADIGTEDNT